MFSFRRNTKQTNSLALLQNKISLLSDTLVIYNHYFQILKEAMNTNNSFIQIGMNSGIQRSPAVQITEANPVFGENFSEDQKKINDSMKSLTIFLLNQMGYKEDTLLKCYIKKTGEQEKGRNCEIKA